MANEIATATVQLGWVPEGPVAYELLSVSNEVRFNAVGNPSRTSVGVTAFRLNGTSRSPLPVNTTAAEHWVVLKVTASDGSVSATASTSISNAASLRTVRSARFDLIPKTKTPASYTDSDVLATCPVLITTDGQIGGFTSIAFIRCASNPGTPTGGTYDSPVPTNTVGTQNLKWSDAPPSGTDPLWMSRARFTQGMTGAPSWSAASPVSDSVGLECIWCQDEAYADPSDDHPYTDGTAGWGKDATDAVWMAISVRNNGVWSGWDIVRVKGEKADPTPVISISPAVAAFRKGVPKTVTVYVSVDCGEDRLPYGGDGGFLCSALAAQTFVTEGLRWSQVYEADRFGYRLLFLGTAEINRDFPITVTIGDRLYERTLTVQTAADGDPGVGISGVANHYAVSASNKVAPTKWQDSAPTMTPILRYLWNYETVTLTDGTTQETDPRVIGAYGETGRGIVAIDEYYLASPLSEGVGVDTPGWTEAVQIVDAVNRYLWNYETVRYTDGKSESTVPVVIGAYGDKGDDAVVYSLVVGPTALRYDLNSKRYSSERVTVQVNRTVGGKTTRVYASGWAAEGLTVKYVYTVNGKTQDTERDGGDYIETPSVRVDAIDFYLRAGTTEIARLTVSVTCDGKDGVNGKNGVYVPPPMLWEDYPDDYRFQCGDIAGGDTRLDMVLTMSGDGSLFIWKCLRTHAKGDKGTLAPPSSGTSNAYWERASHGVYRFLATELLWANVGQINFLSGQAFRVGDNSGMCGYFGVPTGGAILFSGGDNVSDATFVVYADGRVVAMKAEIEGSLSAHTLDLKVSSSAGTVPDGALCYDVSSVRLPELPEGRVRMLRVLNPILTRSNPESLSLIPYTSKVGVYAGLRFDHGSSETLTLSQCGRNGGVYIELMGYYDPIAKFTHWGIVRNDSMT